MSKTFQQLEKDANSTIKLVLSEMEALAGMPPEQAGEPYSFDERRRRVVRKIWQLFKEAVVYERING